MELDNFKFQPPTYKFNNTNVTINIINLGLNSGSYPIAGLNGLSFNGLGAPLNLIGAYKTYGVEGLGLRSYPYAGLSYGGFGYAPVAIKAEKVEEKNVTVNILNNDQIKEEKLPNCTHYNGCACGCHQKGLKNPLFPIKKNKNATKKYDNELKGYPPNLFGAYRSYGLYNQFNLLEAYKRANRLGFRPYPFSGFSYGIFDYPSVAPVAIKAEKVEHKYVTVNIAK